MKKILVSQRRDAIAGRDEQRDATDVRIGKMLFELGFLPIFLCSEITDHETYVSALQPDGILLGGGNDLEEYPQRDQLEIYLLDYARQYELPVFSICRGTQMLNHYFGGGLIPVEGQVASRIKVIGDLAKQYNYEEVNSYHNFGINPASLFKELKIVAVTKNGIIKAIQHKRLPWLGIMWHPERESSVPEQDKLLIQAIFKREV